jgi:hypothetical protein
MRTLRLSLAGMLILALLGGLGGVAAAASDADAPGITWFTGTITDEQWHFDGAEDWIEDDVSYTRGVVFEWTVEWTDPRLPATMWQQLNMEEHLPATPTSAVPYAVGVLLPGETGSWRGTGRGIGYDEGFIQVVLEGDGAYEGQYIILDRKDATLADGSVTRTFDGFIVEGELTPMPDPVEMPIE